MKTEKSFSTDLAIVFSSVQYYTDCKAGDKNPFHGAISFDNIGLAWVAIFLVSLVFLPRVFDALFEY